jgi:hypothetical protein
MFKLIVDQGNLRGRTLDFPERKVILGRGADCDVQLHDDGVSRRHCCIEVRADGVFIRDLHSRNGVRVNGRKVTEHQLRSGETITIGRASLTVEIPKQPTPPISPSARDERPSRWERLLECVSASSRFTIIAVLFSVAVGVVAFWVTWNLLPDAENQKSPDIFPTDIWSPQSDGLPSQAQQSAQWSAPTGNAASEAKSNSGRVVANRLLEEMLAERQKVMPPTDSTTVSAPLPTRTDRLPSSTVTVQSTEPAPPRDTKPSLSAPTPRVSEERSEPQKTTASEVESGNKVQAALPKQQATIPPPITKNATEIRPPIVPPSVSRATYQVGPTRAYKNLDAVASLLVPGDVVEVDGDATYAGGVELSASGTSDKKIVVRGVRVGGKRPRLSGTGGSGNAVVLITGNHNVLEGFEITSGGDPSATRGIRNVGNHTVIRHTVIHDCANGILGSDRSGSLTLQNVEVYHCGLGSGSHQIYIGSDNTAHPDAVFRMEFCYIHDGKGGNDVKLRVGRNEI